MLGSAPVPAETRREQAPPLRFSDVAREINSDKATSNFGHVERLARPQSVDESALVVAPKSRPRLPALPTVSPSIWCGFGGSSGRISGYSFSRARFANGWCLRFPTCCSSSATPWFWEFTFSAIRARQFPFNGWVLATIALALASVAASILFTPTSLFVSVYGMRADFWHLPLIWVMGQTLRRSDVIAMGRAILIVLLGMALLMAAQFQAPPTSFINAGKDEQFGQITASLGRIRPPGTWSFVLGPIYFWALATAFLLSTQLPTRLNGRLSRIPYHPLLLVAATAALFLGATVSGSRALLAGCAVVVAAGFLVALLRQPLILVRWVGLGALLGCAIFLAQDIPVVRQGFRHHFLAHRRSERRRKPDRRVSGALLSHANRNAAVSVERAVVRLRIGRGHQRGRRRRDGSQGFCSPKPNGAASFWKAAPFLAVVSCFCASLWRCGCYNAPSCAHSRATVCRFCCGPRAFRY
jgi:hypothetical protein